MTKTSPIKTLLELAQTKVDDATKRLGELISSEHACEVKLDMLVQYRAEYRERFMSTARSGIDPNAWRNYSAFLLRLDDAIAMQQRVVEHSKLQTQRGQEQWRSERNRMKAFDTLSQRQDRQEAQKQNKAEQRQSDEHAIKQFRDRAEQQSESGEHSND
jgi:flagellar protein FliJ